MDAGSRTIPAGAVAIRGDCIAGVGRAEDFVSWTAAKRIDARGGIITPGLVNTYTHAAMTCFRGLADDLPLMTWLNEHIFPAEAMLDERTVYRGALLACAEMIMSGTTTFSDMYLFEDAVARAARHAGMRAVVGEVLSPGYGPLEQGFAVTETLIRTFRDDPRITIAVEPHSPYLCVPELLTRAFELADRHGIPMDTAAKLHKVATLDPTVLDAETVLRMATIDGARALGLECEIGSLTPGKQADLIIIDTRKPHLTDLPPGIRRRLRRHRRGCGHSHGGGQAPGGKPAAADRGPGPDSGARRSDRRRRRRTPCGRKGRHHRRGGRPARDCHIECVQSTRCRLACFSFSALSFASADAMGSKDARDPFLTLKRPHSIVPP